MNNTELTTVGYKLLLEPTAEQERMFKRFFGACNATYNIGIIIYEKYRKYAYKTNKKYKTLSFYELNKIFVQYKNTTKKRQWLNEINSDTLKIRLRDLIHAYKMYYENPSINRKPKFKSKKHANQSFPIRKERMSIINGQVYIPTTYEYRKNSYVKIGCKIPDEVIGYGNNSTSGTSDKYKSHRYINYLNPRIVYDGHKYYLCFNLEEDIEHDVRTRSCRKYRDNEVWSKKETSDVIGIDWGCKLDNWFTDSNGRVISRPDQSKVDRQIAGYQKKLARQRRVNTRKGKKPNYQYTKNELKTLKTINKLYKKTKHRKENVIYNYANQLLQDKPKAVVFETVPVKENLAKNTKMYDSKTSRKLNKDISDSMFYTSTTILKNTLSRNGILVINAPSTFKSTQTCSNCGNEQPMGMKRTYRCQKCGMILDRDVNASYNLRNYGRELLKENLSTLVC